MKSLEPVARRSLRLRRRDDTTARQCSSGVAPSEGLSEGLPRGCVWWNGLRDEGGSSGEGRAARGACCERRRNKREKKGGGQTPRERTRREATRQTGDGVVETTVGVRQTQRLRLWWVVVGTGQTTPQTTHPPTCLGRRGHAEAITPPCPHAEARSPTHPPTTTTGHPTRRSRTAWWSEEEPLAGCGSLVAGSGRVQCAERRGVPWRDGGWWAWSGCGGWSDGLCGVECDGGWVGGSKSRESRRRSA